MHLALTDGVYLERLSNPLTKFFFFTIFILLDSGVEQLVARRAHNPKVVGSSPAPAIFELVKLLRILDFLTRLALLMLLSSLLKPNSWL